MSIPVVESTAITYVGDGITTRFEFPYDFASFDDVKLMVTDTNGEISNVTSNYTYEPGTKKIIYPVTGAPLQANQKLTLSRETPITQQAVLPITYPFVNIGNALDYITMISRLSRKADRSVHLSEGMPDDINTTLPNPIPGGFFQWDETGKNLVSIVDPIATAHNIQLNADRAVQYAEEAEANASNALNSVDAALNAATSASASANTAVASANAAITASNSAAAYANEAFDSVSSIGGSVNSASASASAAAASADLAGSNATIAATSATTATEQALLAEQYAQQAGVIPAGNFVTNVTESNGIITVKKGNNVTNTIDVTNPVMQGATPTTVGVKGLVPAPASGDQNKVLRGDGTWGTGIPAGAVFYFATNNVPKGFLVCNGGAVSRTVYADLFNVIGTAMGAGNGSTTFNIPNLVDDRYIQGNSGVGIYRDAGLPNIAGQVGWDNRISVDNVLFMMGNSSQRNELTDGRVGNHPVLDFNASRYNAIYGRSGTVQPKSLTLLPCIKY